MSPLLAFVFFKGLFVQGWLALLARKRARRVWLLGLLLLDLLWLWWVLSRMRGGHVSTWRQPALLLWFFTHLALGGAALVESIARLLPWPRAIRATGAALALLIVGFSSWGLVEAYGSPRQEEVSLAFPDLPPAFDGYRIVLISDIHAGPFAGTRTLTKWGHALEGLDADLLVCAGDFISYWPEETALLKRPLAGLHPRDGKVGVLGNHDRYRSDFGVSDLLEAQGWRMLTEDTATLARGGDRLLLMGLGHPDGDLDEFKPEWHHEPRGPGFRIGLAHSPELWPQLRAVGARLSLAGHTHGGQINLEPFYNPARSRMGYVAGLYTEGGDRLFITRGLGCTALPFRFRCRPEIVRITLRRG
ncbi:MAG TPA: metallophosphoesterase [Holophagaceae bacterium]|nr:metallophosphoesterase [Holophagaceae bacterium]